MKIIDLYNMVSKGEQPKKFKYKDRWFSYSVDEGEFRSLEPEIFNGDYLNYVYLSEFIDLSNLNDEIEIIEEPKKIENITWKEKESLGKADLTQKQKLEIITRRTEKLKKSLNEIIDKINEMSSK